MGLTEIALIMFVALIIFGPEDLPTIARALGKTYYKARKFISDMSVDFKDVMNAPSNIINEALKETPKPELRKEKNPSKEELLTYEDLEEDKPVKKEAAFNDNPLSELPADIVTPVHQDNP